MRTTAAVFLLTMVFVPLVATGQPGAGKMLEFTTGDEPLLNAPVSLPWDGDAPAGTVTVVPEKGDKAYPATVRDGELVFVVDEAKAGETYRCTVKVSEEKHKPEVVIEKAGDKDALTVTVDGEHFTTYRYSNENKKPFLWPVHGEGQVTVTRNYPMGEDKIPHEDHVHHKSIWTAYGNLNGTDCWGEGLGSGYQHSDKVTCGSGDAYGWIHAENVWQDMRHKPVIDETREYRFYATPAGARIFDVKVVFSARYGDVKFGDTKEGGIVAVRIRPEIEVLKNGRITNAQGKKNEPLCWGKPSEWCDYSGEIEDVGVRGVAVFDHPENLRHPTRWHVRNYGLMGANGFGLSYFTKRERKMEGKEPLNGDYLLEKGDTLTFNYRVCVHTGYPEDCEMAARYAGFSAPPDARWVE